jgi:hypothetical protein
MAHESGAYRLLAIDQFSSPTESSVVASSVIRVTCDCEASPAGISIWRWPSPS